jgi:hypothetical protein
LNGEQRGGFHGEFWLGFTTTHAKRITVIIVSDGERETEKNEREIKVNK